jgi:hypothetical protein
MRAFYADGNGAESCFGVSLRRSLAKSVRVLGRCHRSDLKARLSIETERIDNNGDSCGWHHLLDGLLCTKAFLIFVFDD